MKYISTAGIPISQIYYICLNHTLDCLRSLLPPRGSSRYFPTGRGLVSYEYSLISVSHHYSSKYHVLGLRSHAALPPPPLFRHEALHTRCIRRVKFAWILRFFFLCPTLSVWRAASPRGSWYWHSLRRICTSIFAHFLLWLQERVLFGAITRAGSIPFFFNKEDMQFSCTLTLSTTKIKKKNSTPLFSQMLVKNMCGKIMRVFHRVVSSPVFLERRLAKWESVLDVAFFLSHGLMDLLYWC